ncbi:MAG: bifunctional riboflavin kinase/FMN adenylyltransferase [Rickettsiales bacterium]
MLVIKGIENIKNIMTELAVALGNFDGVHLGHQEIIKTAVSSAKSKNIKSAVVSFYPHPAVVLGKGEHKYLQSLEDRLKGFMALGVDYTIIIDFNPEFAKMTAHDFVTEVLVKKLHVKYVVSGYDFKFGNNRSGDFTLLESLAKEHDFKYTKVNRLTFDSMQISTSAIKKLLTQGRIITANSMLGKTVHISGKAIKLVHEFDHVKLTAFRLDASSEYLLPMNGAYTFKYNHEYGVLNIGTRPSAGGEFLTIDAVFMNQEIDITDQTVTFEILTFQRPERDYSSKTEIDQQILLDISQARYALKNLEQHFRKVG